MLCLQSRNNKLLTSLVKAISCMSTATENLKVPATQNEKEANTPKSQSFYRYIYPEFLPDPDVAFRNSLRERLERSDMIARRNLIDIPEFYVGSILAVTSSDRHTPGKPLRFVGIVVQREGCGLRATFTLRNVVDHQGVEIRYEIYDPTIQKIEVLRLEKRLDENLLYLRDALPEYSTFDFNMEAELLPEGTPIPVNPIQVKLKPRPWVSRWERHELRGVQDLGLPEKFYTRAKELTKPWEKYNLMRQYMQTIPEEEQKKYFQKTNTITET